MLKLPLQGSKARELVDVEFLATLGDSANVRRLPTFRGAVSSSRAFLTADPAAKSVNVHALRADGELWLVTVTPRAVRRVWNFGKVA